MKLEDKFSKFEDIVEEMKLVYQHDSRPWMIGFSGGKDSTILCSLVFEMLIELPKEARRKRVYVVSSDTMVENPIVKNYMHKMSSMINIYGEELNVQADIIYPKVEDSFWCKVIGLGYPTPEPPGFRWCTERLKINPMNDYTKNMIKNNGEVVILLGVRKAESISRSISISSREIEGKLLTPHKFIENAYVYNPISEIPNEVVWEYLLRDKANTPWGSDNKYLYSLYQGESLSEEDSVIGEIDKDRIQVTGNSRFGCWICTMVKEDKSLKAFIDKGEEWLIPLRDYRNWLIELRANPSTRENKRRNGSVYFRSDGELGQGPFTLETRKGMLYELLKLENEMQLELITIEELKCIDKMWDAEGDLTRRSLVNMFYEIKGERLPWDKYKVPLFPDEVINQIKEQCDSHDVTFELINKLIIAIEANKNYSKSTIVTKAFDNVLNQGWLHIDAIKKGFINED